MAGQVIPRATMVEMMKENVVDPLFAHLKSAVNHTLWSIFYFSCCIPVSESPGIWLRGDD